jgi:hypothetical protein
MTLELISDAPRSTGGRQHRITGGKLTGQKPALKMKEVWSSSTSQSTASFALAI